MSGYFLDVLGRTTEVQRYTGSTILVDPSRTTEWTRRRPGLGVGFDSGTGTTPNGR